MAASTQNQMEELPFVSRTVWKGRLGERPRKATVSGGRRPQHIVILMQRPAGRGGGLGGGRRCVGDVRGCDVAAALDVGHLTQSPNNLIGCRASEKSNLSTFKQGDDRHRCGGSVHNWVRAYSLIIDHTTAG